MKLGLTIALVAVVTGAAVSIQGRTNAPATPKVTLIRTPHDGIQPQTVLDSHGALHVIYFGGDASAGDIEYVRRDTDAKKFSQPIRVNSEAGSAVAIGTVRGPQLAVGRHDRVYVIWFGPQSQAGESKDAMPVFFSRLNDSHTAFEPQRNLMQYAKGGDGGISVAADERGAVYAAWHAMGTEPGENHRRVYLARSTDDGKTFAREVPISPPELGACGCCGMRAFADNRGTLFILYRAATENVHRDMTLLVSTDQGDTFRAAKVGPWELNACPMSTAYLSKQGERVFAAWETAGQVYFDSVDPVSLKPSAAIAASGDSNKRKHPAVAANANGQTLLAWTEGTGWSKGGSLAWQLFEGAGTPSGGEGHATGVPVWGLPSAFADRNGNFMIIY